MSDGSAALGRRTRGLRGPSAFSGNWQQFWNLLIATSTASFRKRYVDTTFGFVWMFLGPLLTFAVLYIFITQIIERFADYPNYGELLLLNVMLFNLFQVGSSTAMRSLVGSGGILRQLPVPRIVMPLSAIATALYATAANMVIVLAWILVAGIEPRWTWLLLPVVVFGMLTITCGIALFLSGLFVRIRDVGQVWPVVSRIIFYLSPAIWPFGLIRRQILWDGQSLNPIAPVLAEAQKWIVNPSAGGWFEERGTGFGSFLPFIILAVIWAVGIWLFVREAPRAAEDM